MEGRTLKGGSDNEHFGQIANFAMVKLLSYLEEPVKEKGDVIASPFQFAYCWDYPELCALTVTSP